MHFRNSRTQRNPMVAALLLGMSATSGPQSSTRVWNVTILLSDSFCWGSVLSVSDKTHWSNFCAITNKLCRNKSLGTILWVQWNYGWRPTGLMTGSIDSTIFRGQGRLPSLGTTLCHGGAHGQAEGAGLGWSWNLSSKPGFSTAPLCWWKWCGEDGTQAATRRVETHWRLGLENLGKSLEMGKWAKMIDINIS